MKAIVFVITLSVASYASYVFAANNMPVFYSNFVAQKVEIIPDISGKYEQYKGFDYEIWVYEAPKNQKGYQIVYKDEKGNVYSQGFGVEAETRTYVDLIELIDNSTTTKYEALP